MVKLINESKYNKKIKKRCTILKYKKNNHKIHSKNSYYQYINKNNHSDIMNTIDKKLGVSIITCTNRLNYIDNIISNYRNQKYDKIELIVILNNNKLDKNELTNNFDELNNFKVYQIDENESLGKCLNYAIERANFDIIAKFDDDDYYGPKYISKEVKHFYNKKVDLVGKSTTFVYFKNKKILALRNINKENKYVRRIEGSTMLIKRCVFDKVKFKNISLGEDVQFCKDCIKKGFKIFSSDRYNHVYIRHGISHNHTWGVKDDYYLKLCKIIGKVDDYKIYANK